MIVVEMKIMFDLKSYAWLAILYVLSLSDTNLSKNQYNVALNFKYNFEPPIKVDQLLRAITRLITPFDVVCISVNEELLLTQFSEIISGDNRTVVVNDFRGSKLPSNCARSLLLGDFTDEELEEYRAHTIPSCQKSLFLISRRSAANLTSWTYLNTPEVVLVSLQDNSLYQLSPQFPRPRYFLSTSPAEIANCRPRRTLTNLHGEIISVGVTKYPPFVISKNPPIRSS